MSKRRSMRGKSAPLPATWYHQKWLNLGSWAKKHQFQLLAISVIAAVVSVILAALIGLWPSTSSVSVQASKPAETRQRDGFTPTKIEGFYDLSFNLNDDGGEDNKQYLEFLERNVGISVPMRISLYVRGNINSSRGFLMCEERGDFKTNLELVNEEFDFLGEEIGLPVENMSDLEYSDSSCDASLKIIDRADNFQYNAQSAYGFELITSGNFRVIRNGSQFEPWKFTLQRVGP